MSLLTKEVTADKIEVVGKYRAVQVRTATIISEDGVELSSSYHRHVINAGQDYSGEPAEVQAVCAAVHTDDVVAVYEAHLAELALQAEAEQVEAEAVEEE